MTGIKVIPTVIMTRAAFEKDDIREICESNKLIHIYEERNKITLKFPELEISDSEILLTFLDITKDWPIIHAPLMVVEE